MIIKVKNLRKATDKISGSFCGIDKTYEVIAIVMMKKDVFYLVWDDNKWICLVNSDNFDILDDKVQDFWVFRRFKYKNVIKNKKYNFKLIIDM